MDSEEAVGTLCTNCGLCCDGALFTQVPLTDDDADELRRRGMKVDKVRNAPTLLLRCSALNGTCCRIYAARPLMCRAYECKLYKSVRDGTVSLNAALATVRSTQEMKRALQPEAKVGESINSDERVGSVAFDAFEAFVTQHFVAVPQRDPRADPD
ncbi:MAG: YkgJ family cysteine cluster protein [Myxococcaceae bacterium]